MIDGQVATGDLVRQHGAEAQVRGHRVDRGDQILDLVVRGHGDFIVEIADRYRADRDADPLQAARHDHRDPERAADGKN